MYIKNGDIKVTCSDFNGGGSDESLLLYLDSKPKLSDDEIGLYADNNFCIKTIKRSNYKNEKISEFGKQYLLVLSNLDINEKEDINEVKINRVAELSEQARQTIIAGFDFDIDHDRKHFSLETHDQQNILTICQYLSEHTEVEGYLYHADGESFKTYSRETMFSIRDAMLQTIAENTERYNSLRNAVYEAKTIDEVKKIVF